MKFIAFSFPDQLTLANFGQCPSNNKSNRYGLTEARIEDPACRAPSVSPCVGISDRAPLTPATSYPTPIQWHLVTQACSKSKLSVVLIYAQPHSTLTVCTSYWASGTKLIVVRLYHFPHFHNNSNNNNYNNNNNNNNTHSRYLIWQL